MNQGKDGTSSANAVEISDEELVHAGIDPILGLLHAGGFVTVVLMVATSFVDSGGCDVGVLPVKELANTNVSVRADVLLLKTSEGPNAAAKVGSYCGSVTLSGPACSVLDPDIRTGDDGTFFSFDVSTLQAAADATYERLKSSCAGPPSLLPIPVGIASLPYLCSDGRAIIVVSGTEGGGGGAASQPARKKNGERTFTCVVNDCKQKWPESKMMMHVGYHQLTANDLPVYPCGVCGVGSSVQFTTDESTGGCVAWLETKEGKLVSAAKKPAWVAKVKCANFGDFSFSLATAAHFNSTNPCTNSLAFCAACPTSPVPVVHWLYEGAEGRSTGMRLHWETRHPNMVLPDIVKGISEEERKKVVKMGATPPAKRVSKTSSRVHLAAAAAPADTPAAPAGIPAAPAAPAVAAEGYTPTTGTEETN